MFSTNGKLTPSLQVDKFVTSYSSFAVDKFRESDLRFYGYYIDDGDAGKGRVYPCKTIYKRKEKKS